ncbi:MAG: hypothetical protein ABJH06_01695 [Paraglaciecola sp.]|uniref:hypothetical protein n=1 Tax=Paraglaciecola sp. TaxID=1920173 RepID=UPI003296D17D
MQINSISDLKRIGLILRMLPFIGITSTIVIFWFSLWMEFELNGWIFNYYDRNPWWLNLLFFFGSNGCIFHHVEAISDGFENSK